VCCCAEGVVAGSSAAARNATCHVGRRWGCCRVGQAPAPEGQGEAHSRAGSSVCTYIPHTGSERGSTCEAADRRAATPPRRPPLPPLVPVHTSL